MQINAILRPRYMIMYVAVITLIAGHMMNLKKYVYIHSNFPNQPDHFALTGIKIG